MSALVPMGMGPVDRLRLRVRDRRAGIRYPRRNPVRTDLEVQGEKPELVFVVPVLPRVDDLSLLETERQWGRRNPTPHAATLAARGRWTPSRRPMKRTAEELPVFAVLILVALRVIGVL